MPTSITSFIAGNLARIALGNMEFSPFRLSGARKNKFNILFFPVRKRYHLIVSSFHYFFVKCINFEWARNRGGHDKGAADDAITYSIIILA